ncbi:MAG: agmatinase [Clostridia bacterium]|nr:agmatinase [Clostridia bacterium]
MKKLDSVIMGCDKSFDKADLILFGAPFDSTTSNKAGTKYASRYLRMESHSSIESYSPYLDEDLHNLNICDSGDLELPYGNAEKTLEIIEGAVNEIFDANKKPLMIGGEHLLTLAAAKAAQKKYPDLIILHFDAHADCANDILGEKLSHGTVIKRIWEIIGDGKIYQLGIRSGTKEEFLWCEKHTNLYKFNLNMLKSVADKIKDCPVYVTFDVDVMDPSIMPSTGTPEGGGATYKEFIEAAKIIKGLNVIGADFMEYCPQIAENFSAVACGMLREFIIAVS